MEPAAPRDSVLPLSSSMGKAAPLSMLAHPPAPMLTPPAVPLPRMATVSPLAMREVALPRDRVLATLVSWSPGQ